MRNIGTSRSNYMHQIKLIKEPKQIFERILEMEMTKLTTREERRMGYLCLCRPQVCLRIKGIRSRRQECYGPITPCIETNTATKRNMIMVLPIIRSAISISTKLLYLLLLSLPFKLFFFKNIQKKE